MIIKLYHPPSRGWLLIAEELDDPPTWDRFLPCHSSSSERGRFESAAKEIGGSELKLKPCKDMLKRGTGVLEYDWDTDEDDVLAHAMQVADTFGLDLLMDAPSSTAA